MESGVQTEQAAAGSGTEELCSCCDLLRAQLKGDQLSRAVEVQQLREGLERQHQAELVGAGAHLQAESDRLCQELQRAQAELAASREACSQVGQQSVPARFADAVWFAAEPLLQQSCMYCICTSSSSLSEGCST